MKKATLNQLLSAFGPFFGLLFVMVLFWIFCPPAFHSFYNIKTILTQSVIIGIAALGMTYVVISGGIDLSVGSQIALGSVITALLVKGGFGVWLAGAGAVLACGAMEIRTWKTEATPKRGKLIMTICMPIFYCG